MSALVLLCGVLSIELTGQKAGILASLPEEELTVVEAIALYPAAERSALLEVAMYPEVLVRMDHLRQQTESKFRNLIAGMKEEDQAMIYNLSRYPALVDKLCERGGRHTNPEMQVILADYPEEIHSDARKVNRDHFDILLKVHALDREAEADFESILSGYDPAAREAAIRLSQLPAVATVMTDNLSLTVLLGDIYKRDPGQLTHELDSLSVVVAEARTRELEEWKKQMADNPEARSEFERAAQEFAGASDYEDDVYAGPLPAAYRDETYVHYIWQPYSYWLGWPYWYPYECWYPYPWWYHWGFYYGPGGSMVFIGMPSSFFFRWYFGYDPHLRYYPHWTHEVFRHYYGPRTFGTHVQPVLRQWEESHRQDLPANWWDDDGHRVDRIREYGQFKLDYGEIAVRNQPDAPTTREFLEQHADRYPTLRPVLKEQPAPTIRREPALPQPRVPTPPRTEKPATPVPAPTRVPPPDKLSPPPQEKIDRARETHDNTWSPTRQVPMTKPVPRTAPTRTAPKTTPPRTTPRKKD